MIQIAIIADMMKGTRSIVGMIMILRHDVPVQEKNQTVIILHIIRVTTPIIVGVIPIIINRTTMPIESSNVNKRPLTFGKPSQVRVLNEQQL